MSTPGALPGRNEPCHCGSGRKYKHCCIDKDAALAAAARAKAAEETEARTPKTPPPAAARVPKPTNQPWKRSTSRGFVARTRTPRKVGGS